MEPQLQAFCRKTWICRNFLERKKETESGKDNEKVRKIVRERKCEKDKERESEKDKERYSEKDKERESEKDKERESEKDKEKIGRAHV